MAGLNLGDIAKTYGDVHVTESMDLTLISRGNLP